MAKFNQGGQWSLHGNEDGLLFKTNEKKDSSKTELIDKRKVDPNSEEAKAIFDRLAKSILENSKTNEFRQPTNEELFGHLVPTDELVEKANNDWENKIGGFYKEAEKPIDSRHKEREWGMCKSFKDRLTEEELKKYEQEEQGLNKNLR